GMTATDSRIRDADMSKAMMDLVKFRIINQSSTSMLAQANQLPRSILNIIQQ
ncbi:MAG: flagellin, partial [Synergistaceae bacterium]|nr:flagellin [Synergistaceae bacterium]